MSLLARRTVPHLRPLSAPSRHFSVIPNALRGKSRIGTTAKVCGTLIVSFGFTIAVTTGGLLLWDATTYKHRHVDRVPVNPLALNPQRGGPKNLKIAKVLVSDFESDQESELASKEKLVIVGGGWGAVGMLKHLDPNAYHVTLISPDNYNLFTPLLPSATVGTVEPRSLVEPLRKIIARVQGHYIQAVVVDIDMAERLMEVSVPGEAENFYLPYDKAVIAVGATTNTHGVPGLEHSYQLKTIEDARNIRGKIMKNLEIASLPTTTPEERKRLLSFVVCGGGPTGVEFASELYDLLSEDGTEYFPKLLANEARVSIIQSRDHILNTYSEKISKYAEERFSRNGINTVLNARVKEIKPDSVSYTVKNSEGKTETWNIPSGLVLWSTGNAMNPLTKKITEHLPNQYHYHGLEVDSHLRVKGAPLGTLYSIGDAATMETNLVDHLFDILEKCDTNKNGKIDFDEFECTLKTVHRMFPTSQLHVEKLRDIFEKYDSDHDESIGINELAAMFYDIQNRLTALPATAQVASQQGKYLGKKLSSIKKAQQTLHDNDVKDDDDLLYEPFSYKHLGSLAYIGNSAVFDFGNFNLAGGLAAMYLWRSIYWSESVSMRTRFLLMVDWVKRGLFGRDLSKF